MFLRLSQITLVLLAALATVVLSVRAQTADPINGGATVIGSTTCPNGGVGNSSCYSVSVQCSGIDGSGVAAVPVTVKVTNPGSSKGAILFISPGTGVGFYDQSYSYGGMILSSVLKAGFTAIQPSFGGNGWLQGPAPNGARALACRFAAIADWAATSTAPLMHKAGSAMCATGVSGGASAVVYGLAHFGLGTGATRIFDMVQITSGPTFTRVDDGCICDTPPVEVSTGQGRLSDCYPTVGSLVDDTYNTPYCSTAKKNHDTTHRQLLRHDSIMSDDPPFLNYTTAVRVVYGGQNVDGAALPQALEWIDAVRSPLTLTRVGDAAHLVPDSFDGALQVTTDLTAGCSLQTPKQ